MAIVRTPIRRQKVRHELDDFNALVNRFFGPSRPAIDNAGAWLPAVNVSETAKGLELSAELPGMKPENVEIEFENNVLTIKGEKEEEAREDAENDRFHILERRFGSFRRSFTLPRSVDSSKIEATFDNGVLNVLLPKAPEAMSRKIEVNGASA